MIIVATKIDCDLNIQYFVNFKNMPFKKPDKKQKAATPTHLKDT